MADTAGVYARTGWLLFIRGGTLLAQHLDLARRELTGDLVTVANPAFFDGNVVASGVSVSDAGLMAYRAEGTNRRQLTWFDRTGKVLGTMGPSDESALTSPRLSPAGRMVAVSRTIQGNRDIWLLDADRTTRFTFDPSIDQFPIWSPDGTRVVFDSTRNGHRELYQKSSGGTATEELLVGSPEDKLATDWSADGRFILYSSLNPKTAFDLWVLPIEGDRKPFVFLKTNFAELRAQFSPDGHWVAYMSNESGPYEIYVRPFPGPGDQWQISTSGGIHPRWGPNGKELYYIAPDATLMSAPIAVNGTRIVAGRPVPLFRTRIYGGGTDIGQGTQYDVSRDGRFLINTVMGDVSSPISLIQNWNPRLK